MSPPVHEAIIKLKYQIECTAIDTLVELTKGNVDASHSTIFPTQNRHARPLLLIPNKVPWLIDHVIGCLI